MNALLLSAGKGTRIKELTNVTPKCLLKINGTPILKLWIDFLFKNQIQKIIVNMHYLHEQVENFFLTHYPGDERIIKIYEDKLLGTGGSLLMYQRYLESSQFFVAHTDNYVDINFQKFMQFHSDQPSRIYGTMMTFRTTEPENCGVVEIDNENVLTNFFEKISLPPTNLANGAIYIFKKEIFTYLNSFNFNKELIDISVDFIPLLKNKLACWENKNGFIIDIGTIKNYELANRLAKEND
jgi:mannose-1-phosphate guanylyltransferase